MAIESPLPFVTASDLEGLRNDIAAVLREIERLLRVEDLHAVTSYVNSWVDGSPVAQFYKGPDKRVHLIGFAEKVAPTLPEVIFNLPPGYRPGENQWFWLGVAEIEVDTNGDVSLNVFPSYASPPGVNFTGVSFLAVA